MSEMTYFVLFGVEVFTIRSTDLENYSFKGGIYIYKAVCGSVRNHRL